PARHVTFSCRAGTTSPWSLRRRSRGPTVLGSLRPAPLRLWSRAAAVGIVDAHDVVLAQVAAGLDLDDFQRELSRVFQAMQHAERNEGGLVLAEQELLLAARDQRRAADHHPVLGAVVMQLQRQARARRDHDAL